MKLFRTLLAATAAVTTTLLGTNTAQAFEPAVQAPGADFTGIAALSNWSGTPNPPAPTRRLYSPTGTATRAGSCSPARCW